MRIVFSDAGLMMACMMVGCWFNDGFNDGFTMVHKDEMWFISWFIMNRDG